MSVDAELEALVARLAGLLEARKARIATAESCTGGWLAKCLTDRPGSSAWFELGFVTYGNNAKLALLGVDPGALQREGAVSEVVARQMAAGARRASGAELAVAITGIAGPDGGSRDKPVGTVWLAWDWVSAGHVTGQRDAGHGQGDGEGSAAPDRWQATDLLQLSGDRAAIRRAAVRAALEGSVRRLEQG